MKLVNSMPVIGAALALALLPHGPAYAQNFPLMLPQDDFTWRWGDIEGPGGGFEDFSTQGNDGGFSCTLTGKVRLGSQMSRMDLREMENAIQTSIEFVRAAAETMNILDQRRELDWAILACKKPEPEAVSAEKRVERENAAREKAMREVERRRARQQREDAN